MATYQIHVNERVAVGRHLVELLRSMPETVSFERKNNPSPSGDPWFDNPKNMASVMRGIEEAKQGQTKACTTDDIRNLLGV
jgi:hypothetical protein